MSEILPIRNTVKPVNEVNMNRDLSCDDLKYENSKNLSLTALV